MTNLFARLVRSRNTRKINLPALSLFGRSLLLFTTEIASNAILWIVAGLLFGLKRETRGVLSLCLLAWTLGLRHALDADHISAIDNATRGLISMGQLPVTCGLFFSLGHSTIVIVVNVAIAISTDVYNKIGAIGDVGGIVGSAVSGAFLFIIGLANLIILWRIIAKRRADNRRRKLGLPVSDDVNANTPSIMLRLLGPVTSFVDRPWKMYPVGVLFGFGFDTASSIALLAVTALAKKSSNGQGMIGQSDIIILPLLFTAGMTLVDSTDSIIMLYSYAGFPEKGWSVLEKQALLPRSQDEHDADDDPVRSRAGVAVESEVEATTNAESEGLPHLDDDIQSVHRTLSKHSSIRKSPSNSPISSDSPEVERDEEIAEVVSLHQKELERQLTVKRNTMSSLSIVLTLISILVAFSISLITIMGLIGDNCRACRDAAENDPGLPGKWWRGWAKANDNSGLIGAGIVGGFVLIVAGFYGGRWAVRKWAQRSRTISLQ